MSIQNAITFLKKLDNKEFRQMLYKTDGIDQFNSFLKEQDLYFTHGEFEEAHNKLLFQCVEEHQADQLKNKVAFLGLVTADRSKS